MDDAVGTPFNEKKTESANDRSPANEIDGRNNEGKTKNVSLSQEKCYEVRRSVSLLERRLTRDNGLVACPDGSFQIISFCVSYTEVFSRL
jgi:hypothetical protein